MNGTIVYDDSYVGLENVYNMTATDYQAFAPPNSLRDFARIPINAAFLLEDYILLDGTMELFVLPS